MRTLIAFVLAVVCLPALADPPDHAKAHGWRKKHEGAYVGYTGREWEHDYGIVEGRCNRDDIGTVAGAVIGGAIGSQVGDDSHRAVAIVVGSVLGAVIGREIGHDLDERDRACVGHSLELIQPGQRVRWTNVRSGVGYLLTPVAAATGDAANCRRFTLKASSGSKARTSEKLACRSGEGTWTIQ
ncbi:MAG TPA: glycine zipper 2TM domain-containing protein [Steroidobacteraceae bacterium]|jgi:surface antigen